MPADISSFVGAIREEIGAPLPPNDLEYNERYIVAARTRLGDDAFADAWEVGASQSTAYALEDDALDRSRRPAETHDD